MKFTRIRSLRVERKKIGKASLCTLLTVAFTVLYICVFAKYALFQVEFLDSNHLADEPHSSTVLGGICAKYPSTLIGVSAVAIGLDPPTIAEVERANPTVEAGGTWRPSHCQARQKLAIIIPYRDRWGHLRSLLMNLHPYLQRQQIHYGIYVVEQAFDELFNKGRIMNIAFKEALRDGGWDCFIFHDIDMVPQHDHNLYQCDSQPRHLSPALDEMRYTLMYSTLVGGVLALSRDQVQRVNGYSNLYWGWGSEDDDMSMRIRSAGFSITRPPSAIGRYKMIRHTKRIGEFTRDRITLFADWTRWPRDGINSLDELGYTVLAMTKQPLYTNITVDIGARPAVSPKSLHQELNAWAFFLLNV